jgi:hypothetical protein
MHSSACRDLVERRDLGERGLEKVSLGRRTVGWPEGVIKTSLNDQLWTM